MTPNAIRALCEKLGIDPLQTAAKEREEKYAPTVKPGARCECKSQKCADDCREHGQRYPDKPDCFRDAVRLVRVPFSTHPSTGTVDVPMCGPCSDYHNAR